MKNSFDETPLLVVGSGKVVASVTTCLILSGHRVLVVSSQQVEAEVAIYLADVGKLEFASQLEVTNELPASGDFKLAIVLTTENLEEKRGAIRELENLFPDLIIAITSESIPLSDLQKGSLRSERIIVANWVEPAHTTFFLELVANDGTEEAVIEEISQLARDNWSKDPYVIRGELGVRSRMMSALVREAFFLIEEGYANVEDIDRACRNDAGYYFPFAGNYRYMDLMGTYAYGMVMKDLNPELATQTELPEFFAQLINNGKQGMESGSGFYDYKKGEVENWNEVIRIFSHEIKEVIEKYPFNYK